MDKMTLSYVLNFIEKRVMDKKLNDPFIDAFKTCFKDLCYVNRQFAEYLKKLAGYLKCKTIEGELIYQLNTLASAQPPMSSHASHPPVVHQPPVDNLSYKDYPVNLNRVALHASKMVAPPMPPTDLDLSQPVRVQPNGKNLYVPTEPEQNHQIEPQVVHQQRRRKPIDQKRVADALVKACDKGDVEKVRSLLNAYHGVISGRFVNYIVKKIMTGIIKNFQREKTKNDLLKPILLDFLTSPTLRCCLNEESVNFVFVNAIACDCNHIVTSVLETSVLREKLYSYDPFKEKFKQFFSKAPFNRIDYLKAFLRHADLRKKLDTQDVNVIFKNVMRQVKPYEQLKNEIFIIKSLNPFFHTLTMETLKEVLVGLQKAFDAGDDEIKRGVATLASIFAVLPIKESDEYKTFEKRIVEFKTKRGLDIFEAFIQAIKARDVKGIKTIFVRKNFHALWGCNSDDRLFHKEL